MATTNSLKSFVHEHERKLQAKIDAAARGRQDVIHGRSLDSDGELTDEAYRNTLERRFVPGTSRRTAHMHYELTPRH